MKVLLTGATGFIGSRTLFALIERGGWTVRALPGRRANRLAGDWPPCVEWCASREIHGETQWEDALDGVDAVLHVAGAAQLSCLSKESLRALRQVNVDGAGRLAAEARRAGVRHFVQLSSIKVNGERTTGTPFTEASPPAPADPYAQTKLDGERAVVSALDGSDTALTIVRAPLVYGRGAQGNAERLRKLAASGLPLPLARIHNRRSFLSVDNLVDFLIRVLEHPAARGELFLLSDGQDISTPDFIRMIARTMGRPDRLIPMPDRILRALASMTGRANDLDKLTADLCVDISKARERLLWTPVQTIEGAVRRWVAPETPVPVSRGAL